TVDHTIIRDHQKENAKATRSEPHPLVVQEQFAEMKELKDFLNGNDEMGIRMLFDIPHMLTRNIEILNIKIIFIRAGKWEEFQYYNYSEGDREMVMLAKEGHYSIGQSGVHIEAEAHDVLFIVTTAKYQQSIKMFTKFINSTLILESVKKEVIALAEIINLNVKSIINLLNEKMHQNEEYFLQYMNMNSQFYGVIVSEYARKINPLKPSVDRVLSAITATWKIAQ
ncbi:MAG: hypothetical protein WCB09_10260, partial [Methylocella sp.]